MVATEAENAAAAYIEAELCPLIAVADFDACREERGPCSHAGEGPKGTKAPTTTRFQLFLALQYATPHTCILSK